MKQPTDSGFMAKVVSGNPDMSRDDYAAILALDYNHSRPQNGERVSVHDRISGVFIAEGVWEDRRDQADGSFMAVIHTDDARIVSVPAGPRLEVVHSLPRPKVGVLTFEELRVAAELLQELAAVYSGEDLGELADAVASKILDGMEAEYARRRTSNAANTTRD
jgi:hypothetical protein